MKLTLFVVILPGEVLARLLKQNYKLGKLCFSIEGVVPGRFIAEAYFEDYLLICVHLEEVRELVWMFGNRKFAYNFHELEVSLLLIAQMLPVVVTILVKAALSLKCLHANNSCLLLVNNLVDWAERKQKLVLCHNACVFCIRNLLDETVRKNDEVYGR